MERREEQPGAAGAGAAPALDFTVENVEKALHQLYYDPNIENKNLAQKWLMQAQVSPQAWHFSWQLLQPDKVPEIQYFGASALHIKISRYWSDIPTDQYESLKAQLFTQITHFASGSKIVLTRLCVALASLALSMMPDAWPCAVADMVRLFQAEDSPVDGQGRCLALLELLTVLPEEFQTSRLPQYRKGLVRASLAVECGAVFPLLEQLLQQPSSPSCVRQKVLKCFSSWVQLEVPLQDCEALIQAAFAALQDSELFDSSVEAIVNAISQPDAQRYVNTLLKLIPLVLGLQDQLRQAVQNGDMETSHGICRIAVALGENHSRALLDQVEHWQSFLALVNMIMFCTGIPGHYPVNETTSSLTLTFWYTLQDDILSFEAEKQAVYQQVYRPVYFQLVDVLLHKAQFPSDEEYGFWSSDEKEQFRIYRVDISDTLMYVYEMLGAELLSNLYDKLGRLLTSSEEPYSWQHTEALLYGFQSIAETIDVNYSDVVPGLIGLIPRISISNVQLADTVMFTIGALSEWLADHPVMINSVLPLVLHALGNPELSVSSVSTLKKICRECKYDLPPYAANIVAVSQDVLMKQIHKTSQCMWLMQALGFLLSALQVEEILKNLHSLISPYIQQLEKLAEEIVSELPNPSNKLAIVHILGLLSNLFTTLDVSHHEDEHEGPELRKLPVPQGPNPVVVVLQQVFQLIQKVLSKWLNDAQVVEAVCAIFEKSVKTLLDDFAPMVPQLCEMLGRMYSTIPQASALDLTRQLVHIFAHEPAHFPPIEALFLLVTSITLTLFQQGPRDHPDIVDSFMQLLAQALKRKPDLFLCERLDVKAVFQCAVLALKFPEAPTVKASCGFFTELLPRCGEVEPVGKVVQEDGRVLLVAVLEAIGGQASRSLMDCFADILFALNKHCFSLLSMWIKEALQPPGFPSARLSPEQKDTFSQQILRERVNKRRVKEMVKEFTLLCRGLHGTDYTADY
ncbi:importin-13 isoform X1 [Panthera pardus]|uniref:Importin-13 n=2 Tax=Felidae TaxID=9681 RepID=A0A6J1ZCH9_ACIJB|nr:importin-13 isoform X1 [Panthera tigris]XP_019692428.1 importin-13 isoform X1 [Felis catus]XP_026915207.2 importin-13 isoform X1 [Acinonyx jubatus]XP_030180518.1 importin-13 isoform X1 [Lynx canadensis]XP_040325883.1 importin-13 isoform X1 [Puma yagouaroundi]XP_042807665.1 importin-13 isoform X1 [Panthera leo]XP_043430644.1 importin-13 isoform X1 [Prionailurus bengalensis]XP_045332979.1 importin-13 isoform X1 [Leopardus geoffroyi]XP_046940542.1 importin-13 isoform X1 [Lynx rufus]XP_0477